MRKYFISLICLSTTLIAGCGKPEKMGHREHRIPQEPAMADCNPGKYGGVFVAALPSEPKTFNPLVSQDTYSGTAISLLMSQLVEYDPIKEAIVPGMAKKWEILEDQRTYIIHLRKGIHWSDGQPFSADDVIFTFDAVLDKRYPNPLETHLIVKDQPIHYEKIDDYTIKFVTPAPYAPFLYILGMIDILPKHQLIKAFEEGSLIREWNIVTASEQPQSIVGTGPFTIKEYKDGERLVLAPNPYFWKVDAKGQQLPYIDTFIFQFVRDNNTMIQLFATGALDAADVPIGDLSWVEKSSKAYHFTIYEQGPDGGISFIWFNLKKSLDKDGKPYVDPNKLKWFSNKKFRQAISYAINREGLIDALTYGKGVALYTFISPAFKKWHNANTKQYPYDPQKALALLGEIGLHLTPEGKLVDNMGRAVTFNLIASDLAPRVASILATLKENMRAIGIDMTITFVDFGTLVEKVQGSFDYEAALMGLSGGATGDIASAKHILKSNGKIHMWNLDGTPMPWEVEIDQLMDQQESTLDEPQRIELAYRIQEILSEELPLIYLYNEPMYFGIKNKWKNLRIPLQGSAIWNIDEIWTSTR